MLLDKKPVATAGNSGGDVLFPAALSEVLAVVAIGGFAHFQMIAPVISILVEILFSLAIISHRSLRAVVQQ